MEHTNPACPHCQSAEVKRIAYGLFKFKSPEEEKEFLKDHVFGGCIIEESNPAFYCTACKKSFGNRKEEENRRHKEAEGI